MRTGLVFLFVFLCSALAMAGTIYDNGPVNGNLNSYAFDGQFLYVSNTFTVAGGDSTITGISIWVWIFPTDHNPTAEVSITSQPNGGTVYFDQVVQFSQESNCYTDGFGLMICQETANWINGPALSNGTYWINLKNGSFPSGDKIFWDQNNGAGCQSSGCPSQARDSIGTIPSEAFTVLGSSGSQTESTPQTSRLLMFGGGFVWVVGMVRRSLR